MRKRIDQIDTLRAEKMSLISVIGGMEFKFRKQIEYMGLVQRGPTAAPFQTTPELGMRRGRGGKRVISSRTRQTTAQVGSIRKQGGGGSGALENGTFFTTDDPSLGAVDGRIATSDLDESDPEGIAAHWFTSDSDAKETLGVGEQVNPFGGQNNPGALSIDETGQPRQVEPSPRARINTQR